MAKFLNLSKDVRFITHGVFGARAVKPGDVVEVADEVAKAYASQPGLWAPACEVAKAALAAVERDAFGALEGVAQKIEAEIASKASPAVAVPSTPATTPATPVPDATAPAAATNAPTGV